MHTRGHKAGQDVCGLETTLKALCRNLLVPDSRSRLSAIKAEDTGCPFGPSLHSDIPCQTVTSQVPPLISNNFATLNCLQFRGLCRLVSS